jgi:Mlc titration factor MtfA (ptsG expression regulator)
LKGASRRELWLTVAGSGALLTLGAGLGALLDGQTGAGIGFGLAAAASIALGAWHGSRAQRRRAALAGPFPETWHALLEERYDHFDRLPDALRARFEHDVRIFLAEKRITGVGVEATEELRVLVAASAVTLSLGWPDYDWDQLTEVLLYPHDFDRDYQFGAREISGQAHAWGTVILSVPTLQESFADPDDGYHVGLHEFAHVLDLEHTRFDGIPIGLPNARVAEWIRIMEKERERLQRGKSVLDPYGADEPAEFLAVAVEAFFETPLAVRERHRELYALLRDYFGQDPAAWDDARGVSLA